MKTLRRIERGFVAIIAVILLVLFAMIGVYMATQTTTASLSTTVSYLGMQAWFAAKSGIEWGIHQALWSSGCTASTTFNIGEFTVTVQCSSTAVSEGPDNYTVYNLISTATKGTPGDIAYVTRRVETSATLGP